MSMRIASILLLLSIVPVESWTGFHHHSRVARSSALHSTTLPTALRLDEADDGVNQAHRKGFGAISMSVSDMSEYIGGNGRAKIVWDCYKIGVDPQILFSSDTVPSLSQDEKDEIVKLLPSGRRAQTLGQDALQFLADSYGGVKRLEDGIASLSHLSTSSDSTTKMLLRLQDGLEVETVIIPVDGRSTLCISSQVGCRQG
ncbi:hypothetical protein MPSEU_001052000 [Mayamaea pseudoterrestris]|nr:hypothetical protein MPSEU_001052000 [Mayamaea pseudoterrestris]